MYFVIKCALSGLIVGIVSEIARRNPWFAAIIASLPLTSILALIWLYREQKSTQALIELSNGIALIVFPSIVFFVTFSIFLKRGLSFYISLPLACVMLSLMYFFYIKALAKFGISI